MATEFQIDGSDPILGVPVYTVQMWPKFRIRTSFRDELDQAIPPLEGAITEPRIIRGTISSIQRKAIRISWDPGLGGFPWVQSYSIAGSGDPLLGLVALTKKRAAELFAADALKAYRGFGRDFRMAREVATAALKLVNGTEGKLADPS